MQKLATILCIDDDETGLMIRKMMLEASGYSAVTAITGEQGLQILASSSIDAVVLDYQMPTMNGSEVARAIRERWPKIPIIMLSGVPYEVTEEALQLVNAFIVKGGAPEKLLAGIEGLLHSQGSGRITILNVDDNDQHRYAISRVLRGAGFEVLEARTGREALEMASARPSLVVLDINLPDMLGFDVCRQLKANPATRQIPVIHISATYPGDSAVESMNSGATRFLEHPEDPHDVVKVVQHELRKVREESA